MTQTRSGAVHLAVNPDTDSEGPCHHCAGIITFPPYAVGQIVNCPHCGAKTTLLVAQQTLPRSNESAGLLKGRGKAAAGAIAVLLAVWCIAWNPEVAGRLAAWGIAIGAAIWLRGLFKLARRAGNQRLLTGRLLILGGAVLAVYFFGIFDVRAPGSDIVNLARLNTRQNGVVAAVGMALLGGIFLLSDRSRSASLSRETGRREA